MSMQLNWGSYLLGGLCMALNWIVWGGVPSAVFTSFALFCVGTVIALGISHLFAVFNAIKRR
jgi:hypothetical protein